MLPPGAVSDATLDGVKNPLKTVWFAFERRFAAVGLRMIRPWERLPVPAQVAVAFPTWAVLLFLFHLGPLHQPPIRAAFYGVFWSILATPAVIIATRNELRKRHERDTPDQPSATD
jgi:hypothetical protein